MATIKEIAKESGFSTATVSIVLSGKAEERKISERTRLDILDTANRLGYRVNVAARRLRSKQDSPLMISVFMAFDKRVNMMMHFVLCLQNASSEYNQPFEIEIHSYQSGRLQAVADMIPFTNCAIVCNASVEDLLFLESEQFTTPIVLFLRESKKYFTVNYNYAYSGEIAASIFIKRNHKNAVLLFTQTYSSGMTQCSNQFIEVATQYGMTVNIINESHDMEGGYRGGEAISEMSPMPDCVFSMSDAMSLGAICALKGRGIKIPEDLEIITMGIDNPEFVKYAGVSISSIQVPMDKLAKECVRLLLLQLDGKADMPIAVDVPISYIARESCGE